MPTCDLRSRLCGGGLAAAVLFLVLLVGCGGGARRAGPPRVDPTVTEKESPEIAVAQPDGPEERPARADETQGPPEKPALVEAERIRLPGQDRLLPSEDPRNRPDGGGAATLFRSPPAVGPPAASRAKSDPAMDTPESDSKRSAGAAPGAASKRSEEAWKPGRPSYVVQVFATRTTTRAHALWHELEEALGIPVVVEDEDGIWKVRIGREAERSAAEKLRRRLMAMGYEDAFIVRQGSR